MSEPGRFCPQARFESRLLEAWHIKILRFIFGVTWRDKLTYEEICRRIGSVSHESQFGRRQLRWTGHLIRMDDNRLPNQVIYVELSTGERRVEGQKKRHKDQIKTVLKKFKVAPEILETYAADRSGWRTKCHEGAKKCQQSRKELMRLRRQRRHQQDVNVEDRRFPCTICGRVCRSRICLQSQLKAHQRRGGGGAVIAPGGPP